MIDEKRLDNCLKNAEAMLTALEAQEPEKLSSKTSEDKFDTWLLQKQLITGMVGTLRFVKTGDPKVFKEANKTLIKVIT